MAENTARRRFLAVVVALHLCLHITSTSAARHDLNHIDVDNMDYDQLLALLMDQEQDQEQQASPEADAEATNRIPQYAPPAPAKNYASGVDITITKPSASAALAPHLELLQIVESFMRLKGEMASRLHALVNDNFDLLQRIYNLVVAKASKLHGFTLTGIRVVRRILEFAVQMIGTWEVNVPSVSIGLNKVFSAMG